MWPFDLNCFLISIQYIASPLLLTTNSFRRLAYESLEKPILHAMSLQWALERVYTSYKLTDIFSQSDIKQWKLRKKKCIVYISHLWPGTLLLTWINFEHSLRVIYKWSPSVLHHCDWWERSLICGPHMTGTSQMSQQAPAEIMIWHDFCNSSSRKTDQGAVSI